MGSRALIVTSPLAIDHKIPWYKCAVVTIDHPKYTILKKSVIEQH